jgi:large subunit ribosomal protein L4
VANIEVVSLAGARVGDFTLDDAVFAEKPKTQAVYEEVKRYLAALRSGTHSSKTRAHVSGAGRKLWKQKGTGRARIGSIRSPIWRHGGISHGPHPHTYDLDIPRKVKKLAMRVALSAKRKKSSLVLLDAIALGEGKTRALAAVVDARGWVGSTLIVEDATNRALRLAARNLPGVKVVSPSELSVYDVLRHDRLVFTQTTAASITERFRP